MIDRGVHIIESERSERSEHTVVLSLASERRERDTLMSVQLRIADILLASERSERDTLRSVQLRIADIYITRKMVPIMGRASS